ncbi:hypothetical protein HHK36_031152 [Tetracentron sinense]|uniref:phospholipase D n=1 Tax=Tetracentron sinense TaxID=13715 RepID=A0A835CYZ9_TETSI|nr:hypothetical protein HHK36_031152 [Tetracentron sinense]
MADGSSDQIIYLHGDLDLKILEARALPNMDLVSERFRRCFTVCDTCQNPCAAGERKPRRHGKIITSDPYVTVCLSGATVARTRVISNSQNPEWDEHFKISLAHPVSHVEFQVKDNDVFGAQIIGIASIPARRIVSEEFISDWYPVIGPNGKPPKPDSAIRLEMKFTPFERNPLYRHGIAGDPEHLGVRNTYFPVRRGGLVTLYQDAHVPDGLLPHIELDDGKVFRQEKCWEDICHAISEAHHMIYIVGWSIYHKVKLVREPSRPLPRGGDLTLGEMLKYKSEEGVRVLLLVWDDKTSHDKFYMNTAGVMQTHDEETRKFFKHSSVICVLSPRYGSSKLSIFKQQAGFIPWSNFGEENQYASVVGTLFTHHQKCVLVDTQASGNNRKITAFIGGLDLCDGRYDTPEHRLYRDLDTVFQDDYHNPTFPVDGIKGIVVDLDAGVFSQWAEAVVCSTGPTGASTRWVDVVNLLEQLLPEEGKISIFSCESDRAIFHLKREALIFRICNNKSFYLGNGTVVGFHRWWPKSNAISFLGLVGTRWIALKGIPFHLWVPSVFSQIGQICGGFVDIHPDIEGFSDLTMAKIRVRGDLRSIPRLIPLSFHSISYPIEVLIWEGEVCSLCVELSESRDRRHRFGKEGEGGSITALGSGVRVEADPKTAFPKNSVPFFPEVALRVPKPSVELQKGALRGTHSIGGADPVGFVHDKSNHTKSILSDHCMLSHTPLVLASP